MAKRKLLGMRLPHFVYPTLELDPDPHVENFLRLTLFFWNPAEQLRADVLCPKCNSKMRPDTERSWEQHAFRVYGNDELVPVWSYNYVCGRGHTSNSLMCNLDEYTKAFLPMMCFKEVGLTNSLSYDIVEQASRGCSFKMIEKCIRARFYY